MTREFVERLGRIRGGRDPFGSAQGRLSSGERLHTAAPHLKYSTLKITVQRKVGGVYSGFNGCPT
jgi:hypothetical protein